MSILRWKHWCAVVAIAALGFAPASPAFARPDTQSCGFVLGFAALRGLVGPDVVGSCLEAQRTTAEGNAEQRTTGGLLVWRKADNWTAFTNGNETWLNGPGGLQRRLNVTRFSWEGDAASYPPADPPPPASHPAAPVLAWYYPQFGQSIRADMDNAAAGGIDALIVSETGATDLVPYLVAAKGGSVRVALGVEPPRYPSADALVQRLHDVLATYAADPGYLQYSGKPVLVFWQLPAIPPYPGQSAQQTWQTIRQRVDPGHTSIWIGEGGDPSSTLGFMPAFDGLHLYSIAWSADPAAALSSWAGRLRGYDASKLWVATVMPGGYYGSGHDPSQWQYRDRAGGGFYRRAWEGAIATHPAMVIVTSFNETAERTEIHPAGGWGTLYVDLTREMAAAWRGM
jgi:hypothetical protein